jgi:hypothetical protein
MVGGHTPSTDKLNRLSHFDIETGRVEVVDPAVEAEKGQDSGHIRVASRVLRWESSLTESTQASEAAPRQHEKISPVDLGRHSTYSLKGEILRSLNPDLWL